MLALDQNYNVSVIHGWEKTILKRIKLIIFTLNIPTTLSY